MDWPEEDVLKCQSIVASFLPDFGKDAASKEAIEVLMAYLQEFRPELAKALMEQ